MFSLTWGCSDVPLFTRDQPQPEKALVVPQGRCWALPCGALLCGSGARGLPGLLKGSVLKCVCLAVCVQHVARGMGGRQREVWVCTTMSETLAAEGDVRLHQRPCCAVDKL